jgi:hypothetical protein
MKSIHDISLQHHQISVGRRNYLRVCMILKFKREKSEQWTTDPKHTMLGGRKLGGSADGEKRVLDFLCICTFSCIYISLWVLWVRACQG